jgi:hypothetical protein
MGSNLQKLHQHNFTTNSSCLTIWPPQGSIIIMFKHINLIMFNLTCAAKIKKQDLGLSLAIFAQAFIRTFEEQNNII